MALTKVRLPVSDIAAISNGTSNVDIASAGSNVIVTAAGVVAATFGSAANTLSLPTTVVNLDGVENIDMTVSAGASGTMEAIASAIRLWSTSAHSLILGANNLAGLTVGTDGKVTLGVEGTGATHLVTKGYVDTNSGVGTADIVATLANTGHVSIPNSTGNNLIINWGVTAAINNSAATPVTFSQAFPNAAFVAFATRNRAHTGSSNAGEAVDVSSLTTSGMNINPWFGTSSPVYWMAIGY